MPHDYDDIKISETDLLELFPHVFTFSCVLLFLGPALKVFQLAKQPAIRYLVGVFPSRCAISALVFMLAAHLVHRCLRRASKLAMILGLLAPSLLMTLFADRLFSRAVVWNNELVAEDCQAPSEKWDLELAWRKADHFYGLCINSLVRSDQIDEGERRPITTCEGYEDALHENQHWHFLEQVETQYGCGGWCTPAQPLWISRRGPIDACSTVIASQLQLEAIPDSRQLFTFSLAVFASASILFVLFGPDLKATGITW